MHLALRRRRTGIHQLAVRATRRMPRPSPGCLPKARAGGHRAVGNEWERLASAGARNSPPVTGGSMYLVWTPAAPGVDPRRTRGCHFRRSWPCPADARRWSANRFTFMRSTGLGGRGGCVLRADAVPALVRGRRAGGSGPRRACRLPVLCVLARERCPASAPWRGRRLDRHREDVATYRERVRRPRAGRFPVSPLSRPASLPEGRPPAGFWGWGRERSAELADRSAGFANLRPFHVAS
jgi:hypothetical protein